MTASIAPSLEDVLFTAMQAQVGAVRTAIPARIIEYDHAEQRATVRPVIRSRRVDYETDEVTSYLPAAIPNCPVCYPAGGGYSITWPLSPGDYVYLVVASRSLDEWLTTGGTDVTPGDPRRHDLTDAVVLPGLRPFSDPLDTTDGELVIAHESGARIRLTATGQVGIEAGGVDILALLSQLLQALATGTTATVLGPQPSTAGPIAATLKAQLDLWRAT